MFCTEDVVVRKARIPNAGPDRQRDVETRKCKNKPAYFWRYDDVVHPVCTSHAKSLSQAGFELFSLDKLPQGVKVAGVYNA